MRPLSPEELLKVWEAGFGQAPAQRALALLAAVCPESTRDALAALSIGQRDAKLLTLRQGLWGPQMEAVVVCPGCREKLELHLDAQEMLSASPGNHTGEISLSVENFNVIFRLPTSLDLLDQSGQRATEDVPALLFERCVLSAQQGEDPVSSDKLPAEVVAEVIKSMAEADPLADVQLGLVCPSCDHQWHAIFDIVSFIWTEIEVWAWRILSDVHTLARAYGWSEKEILTISPTRRQFYLEMVGA
jgi:hypothetical protein